MPPQFTRKRERLAGFLKLLPKRYRYTFEFRHDSWYDETIFDLLRDNDISLCISDHHDAPSPWRVTASWVYLRGHGPGGLYKGHYSERVLKTWARRIVGWRRDGRDVFVYFDYDQNSAAPTDAAKLQAMMAAAVPTPRRCLL